MLKEAPILVVILCGAALFGCGQAAAPEPAVIGETARVHRTLSELAVSEIARRAATQESRVSFASRVTSTHVDQIEDGWLVEVRLLPSAPGCYAIVEFDQSLRVVDVIPGR